MTKETGCFVAVCLLILMCSTASCFSVEPEPQCVEDERRNCTRCICKKGVLHCFPDQSLCIHPDPEPKSCTLEGKVIEHSSGSNDKSCARTCYCDNGELSCKSLTCPAPKDSCRRDQVPVKVTIPGECCPSIICKTRRPEACVEDERRNCTRCICRKGVLRCSPDQSLCIRPDPEPQSCMLEGKVIEHGSRSNDKSCARTCYCDNGELSCKSLTCPAPKDSCRQDQVPVKVVVPGECCPNFTCEERKPDKCVEDKPMNCMRCICRWGKLDCYFDKTLCKRQGKAAVKPNVELEGEEKDQLVKAARVQKSFVLDSSAITFPSNTETQVHSLTEGNNELERREDILLTAVWVYGAATLMVLGVLSCTVITLLVMILRSRSQNGYKKMKSEDV